MAEADQQPSADELLRLLLEQAREHAVILLDRQGQVVAWLGGAEYIFGYQPEEMLGQSVSHLFTPQDVERGISDHEMAVALRDGRSEDDRWQLRKDGSRFWASGALLVLRDAQGQAVGFGKILRDRTDVRAQIEALENRVKSLQRADEQKNVFLATLAHELRNPLMPLSSALELIRTAALADASLEFAVRMIGRQVDFIQRLVDDLLDATRLRTGKLQLKLEPLELSSVIDRVVDICRPGVQQRRQDLRVILPEAPIVLQADGARLQQIFVNLLQNSVKYTPEGGLIWIKATIEGLEAVVRIEDTGIGIPGELLPRIFEMFTQETPAAADAMGGLGIGLTVVNELVALHGGTVQVQVRSEGRNKGSEFTVRLPLGPAT
jgi:two-component system CheB/CheR fusion protein